MEQTVTPTTTKGILIALVLIILALTTYFLDIKPNGPLQWIGYVVFVGGIIWSVMSFGKQVNYNATFGNYFVHGFKVAALVTALMIIFLIILVFVFPDFKEKAIEQSKKAMQEKDNLTEEQINAGLEMTRKFFMVFLVGGTLLLYMFFGAIAALIGAAVTKKDPNNFAGDINKIGE